MGLISDVVNVIGTIGANKTQKRVNRAVEETLNRILPVQKSSFNQAFDLSQVLNNLLLANEANRFNTVGGAETAARNAQAVESISRFDEQAASVDRQTVANTLSLEELADAVQTTLQNSIAAYEAERTRQLGFQGQADAAGAALLPRIGANADAIERLAAYGRRIQLAQENITPPSGGLGYTPPADDRVVAEYERRAQDADAFAMAEAAGAADVGSFGDARSAEANSLGSFTGLVNRLKNQAEASRSPLAAELGAINLGGRGALGRFEAETGYNRDLAAGEIELADRNRTGRMEAMDAADQPNIQSMTDYFERLRNSARTGYSGQINAAERYGQMFESLMREKANRISGQTMPTNPLFALASLADTVMSGRSESGSASGSAARRSGG